MEALPDGPRAAAAGAGASATADDSPAPAHPADAFKRAMRRFTTLGSTYAEMESLQELIDILVELAGGARAGTRAGDAGDAAKSAKKKVEVASAVAETKTDDATRTPSPEFAPAARVFLGMLFLANSRPIHRHLITSARRFPPAAREAAERALDEEIASALSAADADEEASGAGRMRPLAALASVNGCQPQTGMEQRVLRRAAVPAAALVARGAWVSREVEASDGFDFFGFGFHVSFFIFARTARKEDGTRGFESDEYTFQKLELPSQAGTFGATEPGPLGAVANGFNRFESRRPSSFRAVIRPSPSSKKSHAA